MVICRLQQVYEQDITRLLNRMKDCMKFVGERKE
jgi:hypothetical protein